MFRKCLLCDKEVDKCYSNVIFKGYYRRCKEHKKSPHSGTFKNGHIGFNRGRFGKDSFSWSGNNITYFGIHSWVRKVLGSPRKCEHCNREDRKAYDWANISKKYKRDIEDWIRLCRSCHIKYDFTPERREQAIKNLKFMTTMKRKNN